MAAVTWIGYEPPVGQLETKVSTLDPDNLAGV